MARLRFGRPISLRWNGLLLEGPALTVFEIPDEYYEEFNEDIGTVEPTLEWLDTDEGATLRGRVTTLEAGGGDGGASLSNDAALALGTAASGSGTEASRDDHVHPTTGLALSGHNHDGSYATTGHNHSGTYEPVNTAILKSVVDAKGDLIVGTAADTVDRLPGSVTNGYVLTYDSAETTGLKWAVAPGAGGGAPVGTATPLALGTASAGDDTSSSREDHVHPTTGLALSGHNHDATYSATSHNHSGVYEVSGAVSTHVGESDPHTQYLTETSASSTYATTGHNHSGVYEVSGAVSTHVGESDPHTQYLTETAASSTYSTTSHNHSGVYANATHTHGQSEVTNLTTDLTDKISKTIVDAKGDLIVATAADTVSRLGVGPTNGHVLTIDSNEATGLKWAAASGGSGSGDVVGPSSSIDNALPRFDLTTGKLIQGSSIIVNDSNNLFAPTSVVQSPKSVTESSNTFTINTSHSNYITGITIPAGTAPSVISTASASFGGTATGTLTFGTRATGDIILVVVGSDGSAPAISSTGWTTIASSSANTTYALVAYKTMGATPDTSISFTGLTTASSAACMVVRNGALSVYAATMRESSANSQITSPAITTTYGNELVVSLAVMDDFSTAGTVTAPTGYTNLVSGISTITGCLATMSSKVVATPATYEAPGAYTTTTTDTNASMTISFAPTGNSKTISLTGAPSQAITGYSNAVAQTIVIEYSNLGSPVTWSGVSWSGGVAPSIYATGLVTLVTTDGSTYKAAFVDGY